MKMLRQLTNYDDPNSFGSRMRRRRGAGLRGLIEQCYAAKGAVRLLDMGGEIRYWNIFGADYLMAHRVSITLVNLSEENLPDNPNPALFTTIIGDCCDLSFEDDAFDIAHSNSVIEHLGGWDSMSKFAAQTRRVRPITMCKRRHSGFRSSRISGCRSFTGCPSPHAWPWFSGGKSVKVRRPTTWITRRSSSTIIDCWTERSSPIFSPMRKSSWRNLLG